MNRAGNAINHPETIGPDPHTPGSPLPRAEFVNSIGYLPDGTPMNAAGNALNHPETMQPDMHNPGSPLPASFYAAEVGYLVDGTPMATAGNLSVQAPPVASTPASMPASPPTPPPSAPTSVAAGFTSTATEAVHGIKFSYSMQKDAYADYEFINDVGCLALGQPQSRGVQIKLSVEIGNFPRKRRTNHQRIENMEQIVKEWYTEIEVQDRPHDQVLFLVVGGSEERYVYFPYMCVLAGLLPP